MGETLQTLQNLAASLVSHNFYQVAIPLIVCFIFVLWAFSRPFKRFFSAHTFPVLWPIIGYANLTLTLSYSSIIQEFLSLTLPSVVIPLVILILQIGIFRRIKYHSSKNETFANFHPRLIWIMYVVFFLVFSARFYSPQFNQFFIPGYDTNHDSINILSAINVIDRPHTLLNNFGAHIGDWIFHIYPLGSMYLVQFFSHTLSIHPYQIYPLLNTLTYLLTLFSIPILFTSAFSPKQLPRFTLYLAAILAVFNYFSIAFINTAVFASTAILPLMLLLYAAIFGFINNQISSSQFILLQYLLLSSAIFIYAFVPLTLSLLLTVATCIFFRSRLNQRKVLNLILGLGIAISTPQFITHQIPHLSLRLQSSNRELNLFKPTQGNTIGHPQLSQILSLWGSHRNYLLIQPRFGNQYLGVLFIIFLAILWYRQDTTTKKTYLTLLFPFSLLYLLSIFISHSSYQTVKISQQLTPLLPLLILILLHAVQPRKFRLQFITIYCLLVVISASISFSFAPAPDLESYQDLIQHNRQICNINQPILVLTLDEWSTYTLINCSDINFYLDRRTHPAALINLSRKNKIEKYDNHCQTASLKLPDNIPQTYPVILISRCLDMNLPGYQLEHLFTHYRIYHKT